jgi:hypothetical protein
LQYTKNLNYFVDRENRTAVEMQLSKPHKVHILDLDRYVEPPSKKDAITNGFEPHSSYHTLEEIDLANNRRFFESPFTSARGGACCIPFTDPKSGQHSLLGVSHVKTPYRRKRLRGIVEDYHYLSRFYAFQPRPPYRVVARSGFFCLPARPKSVASSSLSKIPVWKPLEIAGTTYNCPAIHFVSGMAYDANDPTKLIISYGVSDCTSWFIEVEKEDVVRMLFRPGAAENATLPG